jgi:hypothetical protein
VIVESRGESGRIVPSSVRVTAESRGALPGTTANVAVRVPASGAAASKDHIADIPGRPEFAVAEAVTVTRRFAGTSVATWTRTSVAGDTHADNATRCARNRAAVRRVRRRHGRLRASSHRVRIRAMRPDQVRAPPKGAGEGESER